MVDGVLLPVDAVEGPMPHRRPVTREALAQGLKPITVKLTRAPGNGADIGGLKVVTAGGWFAVRPSGTEDVCKIYAESLGGEDHLKRIQEEAWQIVQTVFAAAGG